MMIEIEEKMRMPAPGKFVRVRLRLTGMRVFRARLWLSIALIGLAARIGGYDVEFAANGDAETAPEDVSLH